MAGISEVQEEKTASDGEFPQMWEHYSQIIALRQRMLQAMLAYYITVDTAVEKIYETETKMGLPHIDYLPETAQGKNALTRFNAVSASYSKVLDRFKATYSLA